MPKNQWGVEEFKLPDLKANITQAQWKEFLEFKDEYLKNQRIANWQRQEINDTLEGNITSRNISSYPNVYVINEKDSLDASKPMYVHFNIINEMIKIISVKVSFWILNYRAYSTAAASGGAVSSESGGGETPTSSSGGGQTTSSVGTPSGGGSTSGAQGSASGGGSTSGSGGGQTSSASSASGSSGYKINAYSIGHNVGDENIDGAIITSIQTGASFATATHTHTVANHTHSTPAHTHPNHTHSTPAHTHPNHTHTVSNHTHTVTIAAHTHTGGSHTHDITYGIHEEENSPTIKFYISDTGEENYSNTHFGGYTTDKANIDITDYITTVGSKMIKFTSTTRTRLSVQIEVKLATTAR